MLLVLLAGLAAFGLRGANADDNGARLSGSVREIPEAAAALAAGRPQATIVRRTLSPAESAETIEFEVALNMRNFSELQARLNRGERIAPEEMAAKYWPTEADYEKVADWLTARGFTITLEGSDRLAIFARGPVGQVSRAFQASFARVLFENAEYTSAVSAPSVPTALASAILGVNGLQPHLRPHKHLAPLQPASTTGNGPPFLPGQIAHAYNADALAATGSAQKIGIVIDTFPATSDLTSFWSACGVSQSLSRMEFIQVVSGTLPAPSGEETLDVEWSSSIASGGGVRVYATKDLSYVHIDQAYEKIISDLPGQPELQEVSLSYGLGETYAASSQVQTDAQYFASLASAGVTVFVSSGDGGSSPGPSGHDHTGPVQVETPASDPNVTAVGGTSLYVDAGTGDVTSETAWYGSGGGASIYFVRPDWQTGPGVPAGTMRLVPDVAAAADSSTGAFIVLNGHGYTVGGTSWSAPTWAGFCALINQARANAGLSPVGLLGPQIYPLLGSGVFRDILSGSNGPGGVYDAGAGYDLCTGLGAPGMAALLPALVPPSEDSPALPPWALGLLALLLFALAGISLARKRTS